MKHLLYIITGLLICASVNAQSDSDISQRWFNESIYNPAATGNTFTTSVFLHARQQWLGLDKAPFTGVVSADMYLNPINSAVGFSVNGDKIGYTSTYNIRAAYAYYISLTEKSVLSLGLSASLLNRNIDISKGIIADEDDPILPLKNKSEYKPDFDFGAEYQGAFKLGVSVRHLLGIKSSDYFPKHSPNIWAYASSRFNLAQNVSIEPTASYTYRDNISRFEAGAILYFCRTNNQRTYNNRFWVGAMCRFNTQFSAMVGTHITPQIRLGYSFDHAFKDLGYISRSGTHEVFISWQFNRIFYKEERFYKYDKLDYKPYSSNKKKQKGGVTQNKDLYEQFY